MEIFLETDTACPLKFPVESTKKPESPTCLIGFVDNSGDWLLE